MTDAEQKMKRKVEKELNRVRRNARLEFHKKLDEYLDEEDPETGLQMIDTIIAYVYEGWGAAVGISLKEPETETDVEAKAKASGIEIVKA